LRQALDEIKKIRIYRTILTASRACRQLGIENPRIAVSGLNPHCGEGGILGDEEIKEIRPAVDQAVSEGMKVVGPLPADTIFPRGLAGDYDIIVAMYHDQGHIPVKLHGFKWQGTGWSSIRGVNITIGLPIIRTSVDHGTAFGKAGKGLADETSLLEAIEYAVRLSENRDKNAAGDDG
jgi:4-hydroxy-L-threonine phosphate dehydrogenase PdxA